MVSIMTALWFEFLQHLIAFCQTARVAGTHVLCTGRLDWNIPDHCTAHVQGLAELSQSDQDFLIR